MKKVEKEICCPKFNPNRWERKTVRWKEKKFIRESLPQFFHMPLPWMVGRMVTRMWDKAKAAKAAPDLSDFLWLSYDPSPWKSENFIHVTKPVPGADNVALTGRFLTRVFDGPYNRVPDWIREMDRYLDGKSLKSRRYYFYYTTCPKCAAEYGHNYVVVFAQIGRPG